MIFIEIKQKEQLSVVCWKGKNIAQVIQQTACHNPASLCNTLNINNINRNLSYS